MPLDTPTDDLYRHPNGALDLEYYIRLTHRRRSAAVVERVRAHAGRLMRLRPDTPGTDR